MKNLQDRLNKRLELEEENINLKVDFLKSPNLKKDRKNK